MEVKKPLGLNISDRSVLKNFKPHPISKACSKMAPFEKIAAIKLCQSGELMLVSKPI
jgi:hypothetical protein